jgi:hypothetical protein
MSVDQETSSVWNAFDRWAPRLAFLLIVVAPVFAVGEGLLFYADRQWLFGNAVVSFLTGLVVMFAIRARRARDKSATLLAQIAGSMFAIVAGASFLKPLAWDGDLAGVTFKNIAPLAPVLVGWLIAMWAMAMMLIMALRNEVQFSLSSFFVGEYFFKPYNRKYLFVFVAVVAIGVASAAFYNFLLYDPSSGSR